jgi:5-formyltetrahydrofolate cyclo-ligase
MGRSIKLGSKKELRNTIRKKRGGLSPVQVASFSYSIVEHVRQLKPLLSAQTVALYLPIDNEVDTTSLLLHLHSLEIAIFLPIVEANHKLGFAPYKPGEPLGCGPYGIPEPLIKRRMDVDQIDLFFMPLLGFDRLGNRLGYGGGYYDRALSGLMATEDRPVLVGLAFQCQEIAQLPYEAHDVPLHFIVTEEGVRSFE